MSDKESQLVVNGLAAFERIREERDQYKALAESFERTSAIVTSELESLRGYVAQVEAQAEFYRRHSVELKSWLEAAGDMIEKVLTKAKQGAYRPILSGSAPPDPDQLKLNWGPAPEPFIPTFLTKGPAQ